MAMNKQQVDYAHRRIDNLLAAKEVEASERHAKPAQTISPDDRATLIRAGKVKLKADILIDYRTSVVDAFDFSKYSWPRTVDTKAVDKVMKPLRAEAQRLKDEIMLGDAGAALATLDAFAKKCGGE